MTKKVILTQVQLEAVERAKSMWSLNEIFSLHVGKVEGNERLWRNYRYEPLNDISVADMAKILYINDSYEVASDLKYGDWVTKHYSDCSLLIGQVNQIRNDGMVGVICSNTNIVFIPCDELSASTPEEIKAEKVRRLWRGIDREVGDFKMGDCGRLNYGGTLTVKDEHGLNRLKSLYREERMKGFYPAGSYVSFEDGESNGE